MARFAARRDRSAAFVSAALQFAGVSKVYETRTGAVEAIAGIDFAVGTGEFLSIVGPSGCGKSTMLALATGLELPSVGTVTVGGRRVERPVTDVGIVFQTDVLLDWRSVLGNVMLQIEMRDLDRAQYVERARDLLRMVGLAAFEDKRPFELSGGMRQRVSICRALVHDPGLLLMDEPFGALDAITREQMVLELARIWNGTRKSVVFVTHDIQEAIFLADRVLVMTPRPGRISRMIEVDLPRPRTEATKESPRFLALVAEIRRLFVQAGILQVAS
jgi:NitT/TauT family transport system ATP-binding protein